MSFFGQQNNNQQPASGFGGFGSNNNSNSNSNTTSGFGQPQNTPFGGAATNSGSTLFGGNNSGFGTGGSGFGATTTANNPFGGNRTAFGTPTTSSGGMFGTSNTATASASNPFGGFGGTNNNNNSSSGSLFGAPSKPAFGTGNTTSGSLFGGGSGGSAFGTSNQPTSAFAAPLSSALGANTTDCQGTGGTPFQAYAEKETGTNVSNQYQSISFMQNYKNFSFEELRMADYNQGRRYGNASGQPGAFGVGSNFGGFGQQNTFGTAGGSGGIFGASSAASPFGGTATASGGFGGASAGGGLFGGNSASKPGGGLFGTATTAAQPSGGIFGTSNQTGFGTTNTSTGFGGSNTGGLFGGTQQQAQKPAFAFGGTTGASNAFQTGGSNPTNNAGGGLFGGQTTSGFGGGQQQQQAPASNPFGGFGGNQNQAPAGTSPFGGFGTTNQQTQKPAGLFGAPPASGDGGGLFGGNTQQNNQQQPASSGIFGGGAGNQSGSGSLFGQKPASTGTGLFGTNPTNTANSLSGSTLFGGGTSLTTTNNNQNQQNQTGGLFGSNQQQQPKPGSLFGTAGTSTGGGLFNNTQQATGGSLFGSNNQSQSSGLFGSTSNNAASSSVFQQPNVLQPPQPQLATLEGSPYGHNSIFHGLPPVAQTNLGPVATPIATTPKLKKNAPLPQYKINPLQASRLVTPQKRGFGFSYSKYGTPSSTLSTPGALGNSLLSTSIGRGLGKSLSTSNIRQAYDNNEEGSILSPGAFSAGSSRVGGAGSLKRLTIDRSLRTDLFSKPNASSPVSSEKLDPSRQPGILKKTVSFDASTVGGNGSGQGNADSNGSNAFVNHDGNGNASAPEQNFSRSPVRGPSKLGTSKPNGSSFEPEMEQVKGNELAIVPEDGSLESLDDSARRLPSSVPQGDPVPGAYYMHPSLQELSRMPKQDLRHVSGYTIGRENCGHVTFDEPVDLTLTSLDEIYVNIALIELRSLTIYPESGMKPPVGKGLNVPSTIYLENSWPRGKDRRTPSHEKSGPRFNKHVERLRRVTDTEFVRYEKDTGTWVFRVPHFTTYALDFDDTGSEGDSLQTSTLSDVPPDTPTPKYRAPRNGYTPTADDSVQPSSILSEESSLSGSSPDDTFEFRKKKILPGAFDDPGPFEDDLEMDESSDNAESFLDERLASSPFDSGTDEPSELQDSDDKVIDRSLMVRDDDLEMAGSFPHADIGDVNAVGEGLVPKSILKVTHQDQFGNGTPRNFNPSGDWAEELQRTISPRKQDRQALRETQGHVLDDQGVSHKGTPKAAWKLNVASTKFATSIDLMNSLFGQEEARKTGRGIKQTAKGKGFEWPYSKKSKSHDGDEHSMSQSDQDFHKSYKPHWGPQTTLLYAMASNVDLSRSSSTQTIDLLKDQKGAFVSEGKDIRFAKFATGSPLIPGTLISQRSHTRVACDRGVPYAEFQLIPFQEMAASIHNKGDREHSIWELAALLFDDRKSDLNLQDSSFDQEEFNQRVRKDDLVLMWQRICQASAVKAVAEAPNAEQRAIAHLSANNVVEACDELITGQDYRLAILVAQVGSDQIMREDMATQVNEWRDLNVLSEFTEPIRALYGLLAGNTCLCEGKKGPLEDRAKTFVISEHFHMDWKRAFGLRLWYAILPEEPIEAAVKKYTDDLKSHERRKPLPWFLEEETPSPWKDPNADQREDILWGLLKLYAASRGSLSTPAVASVVTPHNTAGNPLDCRLSFQLYYALAPRFPRAADPAKGDQLALNFSAELDSAGEWLWAIFILLHLSSRTQRESRIQTLLTLHATNIADANDPIFQTLTGEFKIPESWIWEAKALHARSVTQNHVHEVEFLLRAENWEEAHKTLCRVVAPQAIIERNYDGLKGLLDAFGHGSDFVGDWDLGGGVYEDFIVLVMDNWKTSSEQDFAKAKEAGRAMVLARLLGSLPGMVQERVGRAGLEEVVAVQEMSEYVARAVASSSKKNAKGIEPWRILQLPLAPEGHLTHGLEMALSYYEALMAVEASR
ncbi:hypothetical protein MMC07_004571 [Pseudocyphellaria aurata]|nr:hypothetical protein [Pseudocyphellaria aurata]